MSDGKPDNALRRLLGGLGVTLYHAGLAPLIIRLSSSRVRALLYHAVEDKPNAFTYGLGVGVTPAAFAANLDYFQRHYNVVSMSTIGSGKLPPNPLVITFDDGYKSVYQHAFPALRARRLPACVYLISKAVRGELVWVNLLNYALIVYPEETRKALLAFDDLPVQECDAEIMAYVQLHYTPERIDALCQTISDAIPDIDSKNLYASAKDIREMQQHDLEFGFHTVDHYNLCNCNPLELQQQVDTGEIAELINSDTIAYPFGYFNSTALRQVSRSGFRRVMTVGNNNERFSVRHLDRTEVFSTSPAKLFAQLEVVEPVIAWLRSWMLGKSSGLPNAADTRIGRGTLQGPGALGGAGNRPGTFSPPE